MENKKFEQNKNLKKSQLWKFDGKNFISVLNDFKLSFKINEKKIYKFHENKRVSFDGKPIDFNTNY